LDRALWDLISPALTICSRSSGRSFLDFSADFGMALASFATVNGCADCCNARSAQATASECDDCSFGISFGDHLVSGKSSAEWRSLLTEFNGGIQDSVEYLICKLSSNFGDFTWLKFSSHNPLSPVLKEHKLSSPHGSAFAQRHYTRRV